MTTAEIQEYFVNYSNQKICGYYNREQVKSPSSFKIIYNSIFKSEGFFQKPILSIIISIFLIISSCHRRHLTGMTAPSNFEGKYLDPEKDTDIDGVVDIIDECPNIAGKPEYFGCLDSDMDGIGDSRDKCPETNGNAKNKGCP